MKKPIPILDKDKDEKVWIKVRKLEENFEQDKQHHRHSFEELIWIKSGEGAQIIDNEVFTLQANTLYLVTTGQVHNFLKGKNIDGYLVGFDTNFLKASPPFHLSILTKLLKNLSLFNALSLESADSEELTIIIQQMLAAYKQPQNTLGKRDIIHYFLLILLTLIDRYTRYLQPLQQATSNHKYTIYQNFLVLVDLHFTQEHDVSFYAKKLYVDNRNLTAATNMYAAKSAKQLIIKRIITEAKRLLCFTSNNISEIATSLGFEETSYFIRLFKRKTSFTPKAYRKENIDLGSASK